MKVVRMMSFCIPLAVGLSFALPSGASGQWACGNCVYGGSQGGHKFVSTSGSRVTCDANSESGNGCHGYTLSGTCWDTHYEFCGQTEENEQLAQLYELLQQGDPDEIRVATVALWVQETSNIIFDAERAVLKVADCSGLIVAQIPWDIPALGDVN